MRDDRQRHITSCYDAVAQQYVAKCFNEFEHKPLDRLLLSYFHTETNGHGIVCDMGCGPGEVADYLHRLGAQVMGVDISAAMIAEAKRLNPGIEFKMDDMFHLKMPDGYLAGIAAFYAIVNFEIDDIPLVVKEFHRVLKATGLLLLTFHIGNKKVMAENFFGQDVALEFNYFDPNAILDILKAQEFQISTALIRYPYEGVESQTQRVYIFARK